MNLRTKLILANAPGVAGGMCLSGSGFGIVMESSLIARRLVPSLAPNGLAELGVESLVVFAGLATMMIGIWCASRLLKEIREFS